MSQKTLGAYVEASVFLLSLILFGLFWAGLAALKADPTVLPGPVEVAQVFWSETRAGRLPTELLATLLRVVASFLLAMGLGCLLGFLLGRYRGLNRWADPWVTIFMNLPALVLIVLCYLWIGLNETAAIVAVTLNKTAMVMVTIRQGVGSFDPAFDDLASVARLSRRERFRHLILPQLAPWLAVAARNGIAIIWKIVLVVEFLGRSSGVGFRIHLYFQQFQIAHVLVYSLSFVAVMLIVEHGFIQRWEARAARWRH
ncbi:ABC transporter permease [Ciceribacter thiooxidans]|uniref:ABC transporter permease n=1 Tax=Ciceribacter thiooxidans TaxID=1969821 RepID=A0ABV7IB95_9HYPH|nr:ABC transporter permease subunit [Ciceribacter thiooxidans]MDI6838330.1 ABC transporter permease subunit [Rhizobiaceae bacterium]